MFMLLNRLRAYEEGMTPAAAVHGLLMACKWQLCSGVISAAKIMPAVCHCVPDIFMRLVGRGASLQLS